MINFNALNNLFNLRNKTVGELSGELYDVYRPDYTATDNLPVLQNSNIRYRTGLTRAKNFAEPLLTNVSYYDIFGNRSLLQTGDLLVKGSLTNPSIDSPTITIAHKHDQRALEGFRSAKRCHIVNSYNEEDDTYSYVHQNVYYDMLGIDYPQGTLTYNEARSGQPVPTQRALIYYRETVDQEGMQLIETDPSGTPTGNKWYIDQIDSFGPYMILDLIANWKR